MHGYAGTALSSLKQQHIKKARMENCAAGTYGGRKTRERVDIQSPIN